MTGRRQELQKLFRLVLLAALAAAAGNFLIQVINWPDWMLEGFLEASGEGDRGSSFYILTLVLAPLFEEGIFRLGIFGRLWGRLGFWPAAILSALVFGIYHGNWIQGIYAFLMGLVFAWGYAAGRPKSCRTAVLMHMAANASALALFG